MSQKLNLEIYEFELENYPWALQLPGTDIKTQSLINSEVTECGIINTEIDLTKYTDPIFTNIKTHTIRSCDPIKGTTKVSDSKFDLGSIAVDSFNLLSINSEDLIKFSNKFGARKSLLKIYGPGEYITEMNEFPSMLPLYNRFSGITFGVIRELLKDWNGFNPSEFTLIKILKPQINDKFLIIGDIHGSYHTFIRILLRLIKMNVMKKNCILKNDYHLIFLGDIVDRGQYGYEIVMLLFLLKIKNPNNVHLNRGNHEDKAYNARDGFKEEILAKFSPVEGEKLFNSINEVFDYFHCALLIKNPINGKYTYLSHGGFPTIKDGKLYAGLNNYDSFPDNKIFIRNEDIRYNHGAYTGENSIRWNDFWGYQNTIFSDVRGAMKLGEVDINKIKDTNIELIIRGHQDNRYNTKIIKRLNTTNYLNLDNTFTDINEYAPFGVATKTVDTNYHCYKFSHLITVDEHSGDLLVNEQADNSLPVITLSTNTDKGRDLAKDSFGILKYTLDINPENDNCVIAGSPQERALQNLRARKEEEEMHSAKKSRYNDKYLKYKKKYLELKHKKLNKTLL